MFHQASVAGDSIMGRTLIRIWMVDNLGLSRALMSLSRPPHTLSSPLASLFPLFPLKVLDFHPFSPRFCFCYDVFSTRSSHLYLICLLFLHTLLPFLLSFYLFFPLEVYDFHLFFSSFLFLLQFFSLISLTSYSYLPYLLFLHYFSSCIASQYYPSVPYSSPVVTLLLHLYSTPPDDLSPPFYRL